ncbi:MAG: phosphoglycolate phosphatase [Pseudoxanthomonas sp.]
MAILDLDGTLVDSAADIAEAVNRTLSDWGLRAFDLATITGWIGEGSRQLITDAMRAAGSQADIDAVMPGFLRHYGETAPRGRAYPGVADTLAALRARGVRLAVCTNKPGQFVRPLLAARGLLDFFDAGIVAGDTLAERKPSALPLLHLAAQAGLAPARCVMVGDSESDARAAHAAGMPLVLVRYGYRKRLDLESAGALAVIDAMPELLGVVGMAG